MTQQDQLAFHNFLPRLDEIQNCIEDRAESVDQATLLATHQQMTFEVNGKQYDDTDLLRAFVTPKPAAGTLFMAIKGEPGVGKTQAIKWIKAR